MDAKNKPWWRNPRHSAFWLVLLAFATLIVMLIEVIGKPARQIQSLTTNKVTDSSSGKTVENPPGIEIMEVAGPRGIRGKLDGLPPIQWQDTFDELYKGRYVRWAVTYMPAKKLDDNLYLLACRHPDGELVFGDFNKSWRQILLTLKEGDAIILQGKINDFHTGGGMPLSDCKILAVNNLKTTNEK